MKAIMIMFDSLNRRMLEPYGCDWVKTPNFSRLANRTATFDNSYASSLPCMPARRELHTGRPNFLHRCWGPLEPFDISMPETLKKNGVHAHLTTDHHHYFEEGGANYHTRYTTWEFHRGQEGDPWIGQLTPPELPEKQYGITKARHPNGHRPRIQDMINRRHMQTEASHSQSRTFQSGLDFIRRNHEEDKWFLQIEAFDPHEPFFSPDRYKQRYPEHYRKYQGPHFDWPKYGKIEEPPEVVEHLRYEYASLVSMCDAQLGKALDLMDELDLWDDTMLIVWTDHGFFLGEREFFGKCLMPFYNEIAHTPFFIWDPRSRIQGERRKALIQPALDIGPTLLDYFDMEIPFEMVGVSLEEAISHDSSPRRAALFGQHGKQVNVTDGRYVYMRAPAGVENQPLYNYTLMPSHIRHTFGVDELADNIEIHKSFSFTQGTQLMKIESRNSVWSSSDSTSRQTLLFDLESDPGQQHPIDDSAVEQQMAEKMIGCMKAIDAPEEQYLRLGLKTQGGPR